MFHSIKYLIIEVFLHHVDGESYSFSFVRCRALEEGGPGLLAGVGVQVGAPVLS